MSAAGVLRPDEVVFYHPLDNFTEHTQLQVWSGTGGFVAGKIGSGTPLGLSAVTADAAAWGTIAGLPMSSHDRGRGSVIRLTPTTAVAVYVTDGGLVAARVATVAGADVTLGPETTGPAASGSYKDPSGAAFSSTKFVMNWRGGTMPVMVGTVSGTDITFGPANTSISASWATGGIAPLTSTKGILVYGIYSPTFETMARVLDISGTGVTVGPATQLSTVSGYTGGGITALDSTRAVALWNNGTSIETAVLTASGTDITIGGQTTIVAASTASVDVVALSSTKVAYVWAVNATVGQHAMIGVVSGTDITLGAEATVQANMYHGFVGALTSSTFVVVGTTSTVRHARICTVSGLSITVGGDSTTTAGANTGSSGEALSDVTFLHMTSDELAVGVIGQEASLTASTPGAYPSSVGDTRIVAAMWARNVTKGSSTVVVQRDYRIEMAGTTVTLGPASAVWSAVAALGAGQMNDDSDHLLVLDFEHTGAGAWNLRTSVDGGAWTDEGAGAGTRTTSPASADPTLEIESGESGQWIDELVLWSGDKATFDRFTSEELANLHDLADTFDEAMDKYEENYGAPICWQATASMPDGTVWRDSGCGQCPSVIRVPRGASDIVVTDDGKVARPRIQEG